jgi:RNA polymerase sigma factor (sigma-70 family)
MQTRDRASGVAMGDDALGGALNRALRRPLLTAEAERGLARRAAHGDIGARERLVEASTRLVVAIARTYRGRGVPYADLVQEGMIGLLRAVERFDYSRGHRLATYAAWWIRRSMLRAVADAPPIRLPAEANRELAAILRTEDELTSHGRPRPDSGTLARRTGVPVRRVERLRRAPRVVSSLDAEVAGSDTTFVELVADPATPDVASGLHRDESRGELRAAVALLPPRTRSLIELRYGLHGCDALTHEQIGRSLGLTPERCRQIEAEGLRRLRTFAERASLAS